MVLLSTLLILGCGTKGIRGLAEGKNLVICVLDAARADHLGTYGYPRDTSPNIDRLALESVVFERHYSQATFTKPSTASLFTSLYPDTHLKYTSNPDFEPEFTLARALETAGFNTALFSSNPFASPEMGNGMDFQEIFAGNEIEAELRPDEGPRSPLPLIRLFSRWLQENSRARFFSYIHFIPPHRPYKQPQEFTDRFAGQEPPLYSAARYRPGERPIGSKCEIPENVHSLPEWINLYDANMRYADWAIGEVERLLKEAGVYDDTIFIVTSDHGEAFGEHGYILHTGVPFDEVARIPLLIRFPGGAVASRVSQLSQAIDVMPTLLNVFDIDHDGSTLQGRSLMSLLTGRDVGVNKFSFTFSSKSNKALVCEEQTTKYSMRNDQYSMILHGNGVWRTLYDLRSDPEQAIDVMEENPQVTEEFLEIFRRFASGQKRGVMHFLDPSIERSRLDSLEDLELPEKTVEKLKALGYI